MNISFQSVINTEKPKQGIRDIKKAGWETIFLPIHVRYSRPEDEKSDQKEIREYAPDTITLRYEGVLRVCRENTIRISFVQMPQTPVMTGVKIKQDEMSSDCERWAVYKKKLLSELEGTVTECCKICRASDCKYLTMEIPFESIKNDTQKEIVYTYLKNAAKQAAEYGIMLLLKNKVRNLGGHFVRGFCSEPKEAVYWIDTLNEEFGYEAFGFCMDTGICGLCGNDMQTYIQELHDRIKVVILRDTEGYQDVSLLPFSDPHNAESLHYWLGLIRGLRDIAYDKELAIDFSDTAYAFSFLLRPYLYPLVKEIGNYFKWQIEMEKGLKQSVQRVLFGAGNMCHNYMKYYGETYPPLFTCDNNPALWGTTVEGLCVKNPEELKNLPPDCTVIICNTYYREIEAQLREMGIVHIGYFNDEYMPQFIHEKKQREENG